MNKTSSVKTVVMIVVTLMTLLVCGDRIAIAAPVLVETADGRGRGLAREQGAECMIITPAHVIPKTAKRRSNASAIIIVGPKGARASALFIGNIGLPEDDTAQLRVTENAEAICDESEAAIIKAKDSAVIALREERGDLIFVPVDILSSVAQFLSVVGRSYYTRLQSMMSGGIVIEGGRSRGMLLSSSTNKDEGKAISLDYLAGLVGSWLKDPSADIGMVSNAFRVLTAVIDAKPKGDVGQIAAIESLVSNGSGLSGMDFRGISINGANLPYADLSETQMMAANLEGTDLSHAKLTSSMLDFGRLSGARFDGAVMNESRGYFAEVEGASFRNATLALANWFGISAAGSNFVGADLSGASFAFADLTNADFSRADLTNTIFAGAVLTDAVFTDAIVKNTDVTSANGQIEQLSPSQRDGLCARERGRSSFAVELLRVVPSIRFQSTIDVDDFGPRLDYFLAPGLSRLERCDTLDEYPVGKSILYRINEREYLNYGMHLRYGADLLDAGRRVRFFASRLQEAFDTREKKRLGAPLFEKLGESHFELTRHLNAQRPGAPSNNSPVYLDSDVAFALRAVHIGASITGEQWRLAAEERLNNENRRRSRQRVQRGDNQWKDFFPIGTSTEQLRREDVNAFKVWTLARAKALPKQLTMPFGSFDIQALSSTRVGEALRVNPFEWRPDHSRNVMLVQSAGLNQIGAESRVIFDRPKSAYAFEIPADLVQNFGRRSISVELDVEVDSIAYSYSYPKPTQKRTYLTYYLTLKAARLFDRVGEFYEKKY